MTARYVTDQDLRRLTGMLQTTLGHRYAREAAALRAELARADVVPSHAVPPDVITMNSRVRFEDRTTGARQQVALVYPWDADPVRHRVSVLSELGRVLLGLPAGSAVDWAAPDGTTRTLEITGVLYQPEARGDRYA